MVSIGAAQNESPVCTPIGSMFSMKQTVIIWFLLSRMISSSSSSQPSTDSSISTWPIRLAARPRPATVRSSSTL